VPHAARPTVTLHDVAAAAGVSLSTASRVLGGSSRTVAPEYEQRVLAAAAELRYTADVQVRAAITPKLSATDKAAIDYLDSLKVGEAPRVTPKGASSIETILGRHTEDVLFGRTTPDAAAKAFISELQQEIDSA
jgi:DNA-binding LacI/PurR family transcriptional regulator